MKGGSNGRVDCSRRRADGLFYFVSVIAVLAVSPAAWAITRVEIQYDTQVSAEDACMQKSMGVSTVSCNGVMPAPSGASSYKATYKDGSGYTTKEEYHIWEGGCPSGTNPDSTGMCAEIEPPTEPATNLLGDGDANGNACFDGFEYQKVGVGVSLGESDEMLSNWEPTGDQCSEGQPQLTPNDNAADPGCITGDSGASYCTSDQPDKSCGTFNGEPVCAAALPDGGACMVGSDGTNTCGVPGVTAVTPPLDPATEHFEAAPDGGPETVNMFDALTDAVSSMTIQQGTVVSGGSGLDQPQPDIAGDGEGAGEEEQTKGLCESNPEMCDLSHELEDPGEPPMDTFNIEAMMSSYTAPVPDSAACPQPRNFDVFGASFSFEWTAFCDFADMIRPFVIAAASLSSLLMGVRLLS